MKKELRNRSGLGIYEHICSSVIEVQVAATVPVWFPALRCTFPGQRVLALGTVQLSFLFVNQCIKIIQTPPP